MISVVDVVTEAVSEILRPMFGSFSFRRTSVMNHHTQLMINCYRALKGSFCIRISGRREMNSRSKSVNVNRANQYFHVRSSRIDEHLCLLMHTLCKHAMLIISSVRKNSLYPGIPACQKPLQSSLSPNSSAPAALTYIKPDYDCPPHVGHFSIFCTRFSLGSSTMRCSEGAACMPWRCLAGKDVQTGLDAARIYP